MKDRFFAASFQDSGHHPRFPPLHHSMKTLMLIFILTQDSSATGTKWAVMVPKVLDAVMQSTVTIPCNFTCPPSKNRDSIEVFWKIKEKINRKINDKDQFEFIYHPHNDYVKKDFQRRTNLTGDVRQGNCSLQIQSIQESDMKYPLYVRVSNGLDSYSFFKSLVYINISGFNDTRFNSVPDDPFPTTGDNLGDTDETDNPGLVTTICIATIVPVVVVLCAVLLGLVIFKRRKRSTTITREESYGGYYANFHLPQKTVAEKMEIPKKKAHTTIPPLKIIEPGASKQPTNEPVYGNVLNGHCVDPTDNVYANVDYLNP